MFSHYLVKPTSGTGSASVEVISTTYYYHPDMSRLVLQVNCEEPGDSGMERWTPKDQKGPTQRLIPETLGFGRILM